MFDFIHFRGLEYQTKDLDCERRDYYVAFGHLLKGEPREDGDPPLDIIGVDAMGTWYDGGIFIYGDQDGKWMEYRLTFRMGMLVEVAHILKGAVSVSQAYGA